MNVTTPLLNRKADVVEIEPTAERSNVYRTQAACKEGFWGRDCHTFYLTEKGWNHTVYPWSRFSLSLTEDSKAEREFQAPYWLYLHRFVNWRHWLVKPLQAES